MYIDTRRRTMVLLGSVTGATMIDDTGSFRINVEVENPARPGERRVFQSVLIDTGAELSVFPAAALESLHIRRLKELHFRQADGSILARWIGSALIYAAGTLTTDDVVFGEPSDLLLLGARSLEGLNLRIDPVAKRLVDAGPMPLAAAPPASLASPTGTQQALGCPRRNRQTPFLVSLRSEYPPAISASPSRKSAAAAKR
jgi:predicted aspartyl protease